MKGRPCLSRTKEVKRFKWIWSWSEDGILRVDSFKDGRVPGNKRAQDWNQGSWLVNIYESDGHWYW